MHIRFVRTLVRGLAFAGALCGASGAWAQGDPPARVARLAEIEGPVSIVPADSESWDEAVPNRPVVSGDRIETGPGGRAVVEFDSGVAYLGPDSALEWTGLDDGATRLDVPAGTARVDSESGDRDAALEVRTPTLSFVVDTPGSFRFDVDPGAQETVVTVFEGAGTAYGADGSEQLLRSAQAYRFQGDGGGYTGLPLPPLDAFDRWALDLRDRRNFATSDRYVPEGVVGYRDLDRYGDWEQENEYGTVWYPRVVHSTWAPYRDGYWSWVAPWGWTWVDAAPWGFAPFHYGRWVQVHHRWGWAPGPRRHRACYAPALVGFARPAHHHRGDHAPVGWFPLGPRDVYRPAYAASDEHYYRVNEGGSRWHDRKALRRARHRQDGPGAYTHAGHAEAYTQADDRDFSAGAALRGRTRQGNRNLLGTLSIAPDPGIARPARAEHGRRAARRGAAAHAWPDANRNASVRTRNGPASRLENPHRARRLPSPDAAPALGSAPARADDRADPRRRGGRATQRRGVFESPRRPEGGPARAAPPTAPAEPQITRPARGRTDLATPLRERRRDRAPAIPARQHRSQAQDAPARTPAASAWRQRSGPNPDATLQRNPRAQPPAAWARPARQRGDLRTPDRPTRQSVFPSRPARGEIRPEPQSRMDRSGSARRTPDLSAPRGGATSLRADRPAPPPHARPSRPARMEAAPEPRAAREMRFPRGERPGFASRRAEAAGSRRDGGRASRREPL